MHQETEQTSVRNTALTIFFISLAMFLITPQSRVTPKAGFNGEQNIWLSGHPWTEPDFMGIFKDDAPWENTAKIVSVLKIESFFLSLASDTQLKSINYGLKKRNIRLAIELPVITLGDEGCGKGVEGYTNQEFILNLFNRLQRNKIEVQFIAMDEPFFYGSSGGSCHLTLTQIASNVAESIRIIRYTYPNVSVGDIEPVAWEQQPDDWSLRQLLWMSAYEGATGRKLAFLHIDVNWSGKWLKDVNNIYAGLKMNAVPFGIIFNGDRSDTTSESWTEHALSHLKEVAACCPQLREDIVLQTWMKFPERMLPENRIGTLTNLVERYYDSRNDNSHVCSTRGNP